MPFSAHNEPWWRLGRTTPWTGPHKIFILPVWTITLLLLLSALTGCARGANTRAGRYQDEDPRWRRSAGLNHEQRFVTTNGLDQEIHSTHDHNYQLLLDELSGDFGIKSDVVAAAFKEPEYRGADTVVVPLYIPRGAIPIRLARIARSGNPDELPLVDLKVSASEDSLLMRRVGLPHQGRRLPPSRLIHSPWRSRTEQNDKTRQLDVHAHKNFRTQPPPTPTPSISIRNYGRRIHNLDNSRRKNEDSSNGKTEIEQETTKRTKKNELSKDSQFPGEISATESSITQRSTSKRPSFTSTPTSEKIANTKTSVPKSKSLVTSIESVPNDNDGISESSKVIAETTTIARLYKTSSTINEINSTTEPSVDTFTTTHVSTTPINSSIYSSGLNLSFDNVTSIETNTYSSLKRTTKFIPALITTTSAPEKKTTIDGHTRTTKFIPALVTTAGPEKKTNIDGHTRTTKFIPVLVTTTAASEKKTTIDGNTKNTERSEHHSVLFPKPVESILKSSHSTTSTSTPSTTTLSTTEVYTNTTTETSKIPRRNKIRIRPWHSRSQSSTSPSSTTSTSSTPISTTTATTTTTTIATTTRATPASVTTYIPTTTNSPLRKFTIPRISATTKKLQLITQKPPAFPIKFVSANSNLNSTLQRGSRIKQRQNGEKLITESTADIKKEIKEFIDINTDSNFPLSTTNDKMLEKDFETITKTLNIENIDKEEIRPIELITLKENNEKVAGNEREVINLSEFTSATEKVSSTPSTIVSSNNQEHSNRHNPRRVRKPMMINGRPARRRRLFRHSTTSAPSSIPNVSSLFSLKSTLLPATEILHQNITTASETTTIISKSVEESTLKEEKVSRPPSKGLTFKSHEQVVLESLSEIMRDATNHSKDRVSNIASDLEALNKRLAERNIFIINAEVDGVKIKLNKTFARGTYSFPTTSEPNSSFSPIIPTRKSTIITRQPSTSTNIKDLLLPATTIRATTDISLLPLRVKAIPEDMESEKQVQTSVSSSFSMHTSKTTDIDDETEVDNEVRITTLDSYFITPKSVGSQKVDNKLISSDFTPTSTSIVSSIESLNDDTVGNNTSDNSLKSINTSQKQSIKTFIATHSPESESPDESSVFISATATVPASVTTRTRSTTVPINTHRPTLKPLIVTHKDRYKKVNNDEEEESDEFLNISHENDSNEEQRLDLKVPSVLHPTSHLRPIQNNSPPASITSSTGTTSDSTTSLSPNSPFFSIKEDQTDPSDLQVSVVEVLDSDSTPETKSSTTIYIVAVIGIIPAAVAVAFFVKRYLNKDEKSLPDAEEQAEGFTPVTHHSRKPSQSNTMPVAHDSPGSRTSEEIPSPQYTKTPWEFPRSKLRLVSILGEGNFGVVWKAEARDLCGCGENGTGGPTVLVAVKSVKDGAGLKERQDLIKELDIMQHLGQHPNVVTLLGCCTQTEPHLVIMEYVMFGKLLTFLRDVRTRHKYYNFSADNEALTSKDLTRFGCDVANGCEYLQSRGIIHRDLAARNILVDHNKVCKIADFGLARSVKDLGTDIYEQKSRGALPIRWMSPESLYMSIFTHKSDVWSFGILCWEIVTLGSTPYPGMTAREVMRRVREGYRLDRPEHCRPELYHIVTKCWHQDLNKRPSFADIKLELAQLLDHQMGYVDLENFPEASYYSMNANNEEKL